MEAEKAYKKWWEQLEHIYGLPDVTSAIKYRKLNSSDVIGPAAKLNHTILVIPREIPGTNGKPMTATTCAAIPIVLAC